MGVTPSDVFGDRTHDYPLARWLIFRALTAERHMWIGLHPGEVLPDVIDAVPNERVVWSSFWPVSPGDTIEMTLADLPGRRTRLRLIWRSSSPPDERGIGLTRQRLNTNFGGDIRGWIAELGRGERHAQDFDRLE